MESNSKSVLVVGFNTRPLAYSLRTSGYDVYAVDFFGDLDLYPYVKESIIVVKRLGASYDSLKSSYSLYLAQFAIEMLREYPNVDYIVIGSGLDDNIEERKMIYEEIKRLNPKIINANNSLDSITNARNILNIYSFLNKENFKTPITQDFDPTLLEDPKLQFPFVLKKKTGAGGINVYKITSREQFTYLLKKLRIYQFEPSNWLTQQYIEGIPVSCTVIGNSKEFEVVSINRQIIGLNFVNPPKEFTYCGNIVPSELIKSDEPLIKEISLKLAKKLNLQGINGFDFVLNNHYPYLMEVNPRVPGSIRASECSLGLNLLDLHLKSFNIDSWEVISQIIKCAMPKDYITKLVFFAPKTISKEQVRQINDLKYIHDKTTPSKEVLKQEPLCSILYSAKTFAESFFGALKIADNVHNLIEKS